MKKKQFQSLFSFCHLGQFFAIPDNTWPYMTIPNNTKLFLQIPNNTRKLGIVGIAWH